MRLANYLKHTWIAIGRTTYICLYPALAVYVRQVVRTRVIVEYGGKIILVQGWLGNGRFKLPGGGTRRGETNQQAAVREVYEETGLQLHPDQLIALPACSALRGLRFDCQPFYVRLTSQQALTPPPAELASSAWFELDGALPVIEGVATARAIEDCTEQCLRSWHDATLAAQPTANRR